MSKHAMDDYTSYLLLAPDEDTPRSIRFGLPTVTSVMETVKADLTPITTIMFGTENNYAIDLGVSKTLQATFVRVNPNEVDDS